MYSSQSHTRRDSAAQWLSTAAIIHHILCYMYCVIRLHQYGLNFKIGENGNLIRTAIGINLINLYF